MKELFNKFFKLGRNPFGETPDPDFYFASHQHNHALASLNLALSNGKGFSLLTGEVGTGKTLLSRMLLGSVSPQDNTALILYPRFTGMELLQAIVDEFEIPRPTDLYPTTKNYVDLLNQFLLRSLEQNRRSLLMIDEAQAMSGEALEMVRLLTNLETRTQKLLQIVLIGQPELLPVLESSQLRQLRQRISLHATLQGLDAVECGRYISSRIEQVGGGNYLRFDHDAVKTIHALTGGVPRNINFLCEKAIQAAEHKQIRLINGRLIEEVSGTRKKQTLWNRFTWRGRP